MMSILLGMVVTQGCLTPRVRTRLLNQADSLPCVYYQEVLNNLAMIETDPARMPYFLIRKRLAPECTSQRMPATA